MKTINTAKTLAFGAVVLALGLSLVASAATSVDLGTATDFSILAGSTITNTGSSVINGDLGLSPGTSVTGFPPGVLNGSQHVADPSSVQAQNDLTTAYTNAAGQTPVSTVPTELGGTTKTAGIYDSADGTFGITGTVILDAQNDPSAVFIFKTASTLITADGSNVVLANGAQACNIFWQVGSAATLGTNSTFRGNILALTSITLNTGANVFGRILARNGAVTLNNNTVTKPTCTTSLVGSGSSSTPPPATPTPVSVVVATTTPVVVATSTPFVPVLAAAPIFAVIPTAPVVVSQPAKVVTKLPKTGFAPKESASPLLPQLALVSLGALALTLRKRFA